MPSFSLLSFAPIPFFLFPTFLPLVNVWSFPPSLPLFFSSFRHISLSYLLYPLHRLSLSLLIHSLTMLLFCSLHFLPFSLSFFRCSSAPLICYLFLNFSTFLTLLAFFIFPPKYISFSFLPFPPPPLYLCSPSFFPSLCLLYFLIFLPLFPTFLPPWTHFSFLHFSPSFFFWRF